MTSAIDLNNSYDHYLNDAGDVRVVHAAGGDVAGEHDESVARSEPVADLGARRLALPRVDLKDFELAARHQVEELGEELRESRRSEEADDLEVVRVEGHGLLEDKGQLHDLGPNSIHLIIVKKI